MLRFAGGLLFLSLVSCNAAESEPTGTTSSTQVEWDCVVTEKDPDYSHQVGCFDDFLKLAS